MIERKRLPLKAIADCAVPLCSGNSLCPGCTESMIVNMILMEKPPEVDVVVILATGCLEVSTTSFPNTFWDVPVLHCSFDTTGAAASGVEAAYRFLRKKGKIKKEVRFVAFAGDGGTYDIGLQSLSGMLERGHQVTYVCLDNEGYMNTGGQRSSASPFFAHTSTAPKQRSDEGDRRHRKNLLEFAAAHDVSYAAQGVPNSVKMHDLRDKARVALDTDGPSLLNVLAPCARGWGFDGSQPITLGDLAVETGYWPLCEVRHGVWNLTYVPKDGRRPIRDFLGAQKRFAHVITDPEQVMRMQEAVDLEWARVLARVSI